MEIWKDFNDLYEVSSIGNVRSKTQVVRSTYGGLYIKEGRVLKQSDNGRGYAQVNLCSAGTTRTERVHRLVALVFIPNPENLPQVNHKDTNKRNNCVDNLEWCTNRENTLHAKENGLTVKGETAVNAKLNEEAVRDIKRMFIKGFTNKDIAELFKVHPGTINCIRTGRNWSHVKLDETT